MENRIEAKILVDGESYFFPCYAASGIQLSKKLAEFENLAAQGSITRLPFRIEVNGDFMNAIGNLLDLKQQLNVNINLALDGGVLINGLQKFTGTFQILRAYKIHNRKGGEVEMIFTEGASSLKNQLDNVTVAEVLSVDPDTGTEVEFPLDNFDFNLTNWVSNPRGHADTYGFGWILLDAGQRWNNTADPNDLGKDISQIERFDFWPVLYVWKLFEYFEKNYGIQISFTSDYDPYVTWQGIIMRRGELSQPTYTKGYVRDNVMGRTTTSTSGPFVIPPANTGTVQILQRWQTVISGISFFDPANNRAVVPISGYYKWSLSLNFDFTATGFTGTNIISFDYWLVDQTTGLQVQKIGTKLYPCTSGVAVAQFITLPFEGFIPAGNYDIRAYVSQTDNTNSNITYRLFTNSLWKVLIGPAGSGAGLTIFANQNVDEDLTMWDVLSTLVYQLNGVVKKTGVNEWEIEPWESFIESGTDEDLSSRIEDGSTITIEPFSTMGARSVRLRWKEDGDKYNERFQKYTGISYGEYWKRKYETDFATKEIRVELPFSASPLAPTYDQSLNLIQLVDEDGIGIKANPRLIMYYIDDGVETKNYLGEVVSVPIYTGSNADVKIWPAGHYLYHNAVGAGVANDNITTEFLAGNTFFSNAEYPFFGDLFTLWWKNYLEQTYSEDSRRVKMRAKFEQYEFKDLTFANRYLLDGVAYRLLEVNNYSLSQTGPAQAIFAKRLKIDPIDTAPIYPYAFQSDGVVVLWRDSSDNSDLGASPISAAVLEAACNAYGIVYDADTSIYANGVGLVVGVLLR